MTGDHLQCYLGPDSEDRYVMPEPVGHLIPLTCTLTATKD